jgi:hypothetical protein
MPVTTRPDRKPVRDELERRGSEPERDRHRQATDRCRVRAGGAPRGTRVFQRSPAAAPDAVAGHRPPGRDDDPREALCAASAASRRNWARTAALDQARAPRVGPSITQNSGPTGSCVRLRSHGRSAFQAHMSMPTSRRCPPLPCCTRTEQRFASKSVSVSASASWIRSAARHSTTISARTRKPWRSSPAWRMTATISSTVGGLRGMCGPCYAARGRRDSQAASRVTGDGRPRRTAAVQTWLLLEERVDDLPAVAATPPRREQSAVDAPTATAGGVATGRQLEAEFDRDLARRSENAAAVPIRQPDRGLEDFCFVAAAAC